MAKPTDPVYRRMHGWDVPPQYKAGDRLRSLLYIGIEIEILGARPPINKYKEADYIIKYLTDYSRPSGPIVYAEELNRMTLSYVETFYERIPSDEHVLDREH